MFDYTVLIGIGVIVLCFVFLRFGKPYIKDKSIFEDVRLALMLGTEIIRDDKINSIIDIVQTVVSDVENLNNVDNSEKEATAVQLATKDILEKLHINMSKDTISLIVRIAVSYLPPTNK